MSPLGKFSFGFVAGLALVTAAFYGLFYAQLGAPTYSSQWCWDINQRKQELADKAGSPKLLLIGGSATLFGLSAKEIQAQTGCPTVNMGTHAALGPEYILDLSRNAAKPGDTVLLAFEYEVYTPFVQLRGGEWTDKLYYDYIFARDPDFFRSWPVDKQIRTAMMISTSRLKEGFKNRGRILNPVDGPIYSVYRLNKYGDQTGNTADKRPAGEPWMKLRSENLVRGVVAGHGGLRLLEEYLSWARRNNVRVLATFPTICYRDEYDGPKAAGLEAAIRGFFESRQVPVLGTAREAMLPPTLFFDTLYHPTEEGARERTRRLIAHLKPLLGGSDVSQATGAPPTP